MNSGAIKRSRSWIMAGALAAVACTNSASAQTRDTARAVTLPKQNAALRISKWSALALTAGAAAYGFTTNRTADANYAELEQLCVSNRLNCARRDGDAFADADLERRYQDVRTLDSRARTALIASQLGVAATVVLFVIDLRHNRPPRDIPYQPRTLELMPRTDGGVQLQLTLPLSLDKRQH
jgi:hypothetical protein